MDKTAVLEIIERFRSALENNGVRDSMIVLFGSYATGRAHEASDIDLAVVSASFEGKNLWERIEMLSGAVYELFEPIEALAFTPEEWERGESIIAQIARQGEVAAR